MTNYIYTLPVTGYRVYQMYSDNAVGREYKTLAAAVRLAKKLSDAGEVRYMAMPLSAPTPVLTMAGETPVYVGGR